jgi:hypothetical protein
MYWQLVASTLIYDHITAIFNFLPIVNSKALFIIQRNTNEHMISGKYTLKASITVRKAHLACTEKGSAIKSSLPWLSFIFYLSSEDDEVSDGSSMLFFTCKNTLQQSLF